MSLFICLFRDITLYPYISLSYLFAAIFRTQWHYAAGGPILIRGTMKPLLLLGHYEVHRTRHYGLLHVNLDCIPLAQPHAIWLPMEQ